MKSALIVFVLARWQCLNWIGPSPDYLSLSGETSDSALQFFLHQGTQSNMSNATSLSAELSHTATTHSAFWCHVAVELCLVFLIVRLKTAWSSSKAQPHQNKLPAPDFCAQASVVDSVELETFAMPVNMEHERLREDLQRLTLAWLTVDVKDMRALQEYLDLLVHTLDDAQRVGLAESDLVSTRRQRRKVHNMIQDLKGSVRVFCRVRPLNSKECSQGEEHILRSPDDMTIEIGGGSIFNFDSVFNSGTQESIFEECKDLVQSVIDGHSVVLFSYGQTGAGKTFTMYGDPGNEGIGPRAVRELYELMDATGDRVSYTVTAQVLEIQGNSAADLTRGGSLQTSSAPRPGTHQQKSGAAGVIVSSAEDLMTLFVRGQNLRKTCATAMNPKSSRSHLVFSVEVACVDTGTGASSKGKLILCDLAGSERVKKSQVSGEHLKEAIQVNKSLTALFDVLETLTKQGPQWVIPYRNSRLTQVLKDSLGGTSKALMFVHCSPAASNRNETLMTLGHGARAKKITNVPNNQARSHV